MKRNRLITGFLLAAILCGGIPTALAQSAHFIFGPGGVKVHTEVPSVHVHVGQPAYYYYYDDDDDDDYDYYYVKHHKHHKHHKHYKKHKKHKKHYKEYKKHHKHYREANYYAPPRHSKGYRVKAKHHKEHHDVRLAPKGYRVRRH